MYSKLQGRVRRTGTIKGIYIIISAIDYDMHNIHS